MLNGVDKNKSKSEITQDPVTQQAQPPSKEQVQNNPEAKERDERGPWTLWSQSNNQAKSVSVLATTQTDNERLAEILKNYGNNLFKWPPLHRALEAGNYEDALFLVEKGADFRETIRISGHSYFPIDIIFIDIGMLTYEKLIEINSVRKRNAEVKSRGSKIPDDKQEIIKRLLFTLIKKGALETGNGRMPFNLNSFTHQILFNNWYDLYDALIKSMRFRTDIRWDSSYNRFIGDGDELAIEILDRNLLNIPNMHLPTIHNRLIMAINNNNFKMVKYFIDRGANVNYEHGPTKKKPLAIAVTIGNNEIIDLLIAKGAKLG